MLGGEFWSTVNGKIKVYVIEHAIFVLLSDVTQLGKNVFEKI